MAKSAAFVVWPQAKTKLSKIRLIHSPRILYTSVMVRREYR